jgi:hypothetical protein
MSDGNKQLPHMKTSRWESVRLNLRSTSKCVSFKSLSPWLSMSLKERCEECNWPAPARDRNSEFSLMKDLQHKSVSLPVRLYDPYVVTRQRRAQWGLNPTPTQGGIGFLPWGVRCLASAQMSRAGPLFKMFLWTQNELKVVGEKWGNM